MSQSALSGRRAAREAALLIMFAADASALEPGEAADLFAAHLRDDEEVLQSLFGEEEAEPDPAVVRRARAVLSPQRAHWGFARRLVDGALGHLDALDTLVGKCSLNWKVPRMSRVDRNVLRLAAYELAFEPDVPVRATLNEAIELAKRYGTEDSGKFVNGILDRIAQELGRV